MLFLDILWIKLNSHCILSVHIVVQNHISLLQGECHPIVILFYKIIKLVLPFIGVHFCNQSGTFDIHQTGKMFLESDTTSFVISTVKCKICVNQHYFNKRLQNISLYVSPIYITAIHPKISKFLTVSPQIQFQFWKEFSECFGKLKQS